MKSTTDIKSKILSKETVFKSKYFKIDKVTIERDGRVFTKDIQTRTPIVLIVPLTDNNEIYLVSQYRDTMQKVLIETVAGHVEEGLSVLENAQKELKEETGLTAKSWKQIGEFYVSASIAGGVRVFVATDLEEGEQDLDEDEDIKVIKVPFDEALKKIETGEISVSSNVAALLLLDKLRMMGKFNL